jgi:hypothetical protein
LGSLQEIVLKYLKENGITIRFLAKSIDTDYAFLNCWLHGKRKFSDKRIARVHDFLNGNYYKSPDSLFVKKEDL